MPQLFDMEADPHECVDIASDKENADLIAEFREIQKRYWDPDKAMKDLDEAKVNFRLMTKWFSLVKPPLVGEWRGNPERNYLL